MKMPVQNVFPNDHPPHVQCYLLVIMQRSCVHTTVEAAYNISIFSFFFANSQYTHRSPAKKPGCLPRWSLLTRSLN